MNNLDCNDWKDSSFRLERNLLYIEIASLLVLNADGILHLRITYQNLFLTLVLQRNIFA